MKTFLRDTSKRPKFALTILAAVGAATLALTLAGQSPSGAQTGASQFAATGP